MTEKNITELEEKALYNICYSDHRNGNLTTLSCEVSGHVGVYKPRTIPKKSVSGVVSSLVKKGLLTTEEDTSGEGYDEVTLTESGFLVVKNLGYLYLDEEGIYQSTERN